MLGNNFLNQTAYKITSIKKIMRTYQFWKELETFDSAHKIQEA